MARASEILILIAFNNFCEIFHQVQSFPIRARKDKSFKTSGQSELISINRITSLYVITILAFTWIAISAIGWGFYYGLKQKLSENVDQTTNKIYIENEDPEKSGKESPVHIYRPAIQMDNPQMIDTGFSEKSRATESVERKPQQVELTPRTKITNNPQKIDTGFSEKSRATESTEREPQQVEPIPSTRITKDSVIHSTAETSWTDSKRSKLHRSSKRRKKHDRTHSSDYNQITPVDVRLLKSEPNKNPIPSYVPQHLQVLSSTEIKPECQFMQSKEEKQNPILRPVSAFIPQFGMPEYVDMGCSRPCRCHHHTDGIFVKPSLHSSSPRNCIKTTEQVSNDSPDNLNQQDVCCYAKKPKGGSIHPIIQGYRVRGKFRVKGKKNEDVISFWEDSYDVVK